MKDYNITMLTTYLNKATAIAEQYPELSDVWDKIEDALHALDQINFEEAAE
jgi:hypothetical protein